MSYRVGWESGSLNAGTHKFHRKTFVSKKRAFTVAARASRLTKGYVIIESRGREIAECYKGACRAPQRRRR